MLRQPRNGTQPEQATMPMDVGRKLVCADCVNDHLLEKLIRDGATSCECNYCGTRSTMALAAPVATILPAVERSLRRHFEPERTSACEPNGGGSAVESTVAALRSFRWRCCDGLLVDVAGTFDCNAWRSVPPSDLSEVQRSELLDWSWLRFTEVVMHESRFNFQTAENLPAEGMLCAGAMLAAIGEFVVERDLLRAIQRETRLYRARVKGPQDDWDVHCPAQLGAPPKERASAGRMNPAGIPYLYTAFERSTAIGEVTVPLPRLPIEIVLATFEASRELSVLDLSGLPPPRSVFDEKSQPVDEMLEFLARFARDLALPVAKDGSEHIEYVPSQVVSEYFAQVFLPNGPDSAPLDGLIYRSSVCPGGRNLVLFPGWREPKFSSVIHVKQNSCDIRDWQHLSRAVCIDH